MVQSQELRKNYVRVIKIYPRALVNRPVRKSSESADKRIRLPSLRERLLFVIWLAGRELGVDSQQSFAQAIDKDPTQLSQWVREEKRPSWDSIKRVADAVSVDAEWLDDPTRQGAAEPPDFQKWFVSRLKRESEERRKRG